MKIPLNASIFGLLLFLFYCFMGGGSGICVSSLEARSHNTDQEDGSKVSQQSSMNNERAPNSVIKEARRLLHLQQWDAVVEMLEKNTWVKEHADTYGLLGHAFYSKSIFRHKRDTPLRALFRYIYGKRSIENFKRAIELDPDNLEWQYGLTTLYISRKGEKSLRKAGDLLLKIQSKNKSYLNVPFLLGIVYRRLNDIEKSEMTFEEFLKSKPDPRTMLELAEIHVEKGDLIKAEQYYLKALDNLEDKKDIRLIVRDIWFLLSTKEKKGYAKSKDKGRWLKKFWLERDPTPRTPENERVQEHLRRISYACAHYNSPGAQARYDDRGEIYIKYGPPSYRYQDIGNEYVYQNETWTYDWELKNNKDGLVFDFANDPGYGFRLITDLREAFATTWSMRELRRLYWDREDVNIAYYAMLAHSFDLVDFYEKFRDMYHKKNKAYKAAPAQVFKYEGFPKKRLSIYLQDATFRGENRNTRHEVYFGFPMKEIHFNSRSKYLHTSLIREVTVRNFRAEELYFDYKILELSFPKMEKTDDKKFIGQVNFDLSPQSENPILHFSVSDPNDDRLGLYYYELRDRDYTGDDLLLSDIKFSYRITPTREPHDFTRNGLRIEPYLTSAFNKNIPVQVYFEIYNLSSGAANETLCRIQYTVEREIAAEGKALIFFDVWGNIIKPAGRSNYMSLTNEIVLTGPDHAEYTTIDLSALKDGAYNFVVTVTNLAANQSAESSRLVLLYTD